MNCLFHRLRVFGRIGLLSGLLVFAGFSSAMLVGPAGGFVQSAVAQASTGSAERPAALNPQPAAPAAKSTPPAQGQQRKNSARWLWGLGAGLVALMGFFLLRILTTKPQAMPKATEDESARVRRHQHRRGQGRTPASREEQRISETSRDEFLNAPMRQSATGMAASPSTLPDPNPKP